MSFIEDIKKPINFISIAIAIISIIISIVFYFKSKKEMVPTYTISSSQYKIFDSKTSSSGITLIDSEKKPITSDVYLVETAFWNSGQLPIEPANVRIPVKINISDCSQILEFKIIKQIKPDIAKFRIMKDTSVFQNPQEKSLLLLWDHLDPNFGIRIQIIYAGQSSSKLSYSGYITGIDNFLNSPQNEEYTFFDKVLALIAIALFFSLCIDIITLVYRLILRFINKPYKHFNYFSMALSFLLLVLIIIIFNYFVINATPPV